MDILILFLVILVIYLIYFIPLYKRTKELEKKLNKGTKLDQYLAEIEKFINKTKNKKYQNFLLINKAAGLSAQGKYREATSLLNLFDQVKELKELPKVYLVQYYNHLLYSLLMTDKHNEAERLYSATFSLLSGYINHKSLRNMLLSTFATYEFYLGDKKKSREFFETLLKDQGIIPLQQISSLYFLGMMDLQDDNKAEAKEKLEELLTIEHDNTYFDKKATNLLKDL